MSEGEHGEISSDAAADRTTPLDDEAVDYFVRKLLKSYIEKRLGVRISEGWRQIGRKYEYFRDEDIEEIKDPDFASVATAYVSLRSQDRQARWNTRMQILIVLLAAASTFASLVQLLVKR